MKDNSHQSNVFYTATPGYRLPVLAKIDQTGGIFFCLTVLKGVCDENLKWLVNKGLLLSLLKK